MGNAQAFRLGSPPRILAQGRAAVGNPASATVVYIVEDDDAVREGFTRLLRSAGLEVRAYDCPERFLAEVVDLPGACILLDITMPRITGPEVQARLRHRRIALPVITISARDDEKTRACARELGARMFLRKPVDDQAMLDAIAWVVGRGSSAR
jgi:FixJ family two-component response regulator